MQLANLLRNERVERGVNFTVHRVPHRSGRRGRGRASRCLHPHCRCIAELAKLAIFCKFLAGSFSAVSKRNFARKYAFDSIFQDLQDLHTFAPLQSQNFREKTGPRVRRRACIRGLGLAKLTLEPRRRRPVGWRTSRLANIFATLIFANFWRARSRVYRHQLLQVDMHFAAFFKFYKMCTLLHRSELNILAKNLI